MLKKLFINSQTSISTLKLKIPKTAWKIFEIKIIFFYQKIFLVYKSIAELIWEGTLQSTEHKTDWLTYKDELLWNKWVASGWPKRLKERTNGRKKTSHWDRMIDLLVKRLDLLVLLDDWLTGFSENWNIWDLHYLSWIMDWRYTYF